jgi:flagellar L-ring protein precursor FlgH
MSFTRITITALMLALVIAPLAAESLWTPGSRNLCVDLRPSQVGDLVTVLIIEGASSSQEASTDLSKSTDHSNGAGLGPFIQLIPEVAFNSGQTSSSAGQSTMSNKFATRLAATVTKVMPNGNLQIQAVRSLNMNGEKQEVTLTGIVRPQDIASDNTVLSTSLADVAINYIGKGPSGRRQQEGVITKILSYLF